MAHHDLFRCGADQKYLNLEPSSQTTNIYLRIIISILLIFTIIDDSADEISITQGRAIIDIENLYECGELYRKSGIGHYFLIKLIRNGLYQPQLLTLTVPK